MHAFQVIWWNQITWLGRNAFSLQPRHAKTMMRWRGVLEVVADGDDSDH
jgi:hypothetical protein